MCGETSKDGFSGATASNDNGYPANPEPRSPEGFSPKSTKYDKEAYRCIQAVQLGKHIYVLHAFQKKAKKGISTPKEVLDLIERRFKEAKALEKYGTHRQN